MATPSARMLALLSLLQTRRDWPGGVLADRLDVSDRTLRRDVDRLRELGYRVLAFKGPDGGYRLDAGSELPPLLFDDEQAVALAVALQASWAAGLSDPEPALRALHTVRQVMPSRLRHRVDSISFSTAPPSEPGVASDVLVALSTAVRAQEVLRFEYVQADKESDSKPSRRRIEPHHLVFRNARWYVVGWDLDVDDWRVFRADRMVPKIPTGPTFHPRSLPGGDVQQYLSGRFRGSAGSSASWPCEGSAVLGMAASLAAPFIGEGSVEELEKDTCRVTMGSWSWVALAASLARFDAPIHYAEPAGLVDAFAHLAQRFLAVDRGQ
ncbi:WYL domain-containing protein [Paenarthrobacter ilicis]|uniref:helix-turn-helix transcriptional regulator n=1 Tax=Paenarthrobacter ilicis TaxID=43665 RepID=UPI0028D4040D|nr:WYL domain-containing protein [Paenarthrobacter ilicis]